MNIFVTADVGETKAPTRKTQMQSSTTASSSASHHDIVPSTPLDDLSENVKRLQSRLRETQTSMFRICERANELKQRVSQQHQKQDSLDQQQHSAHKQDQESALQKQKEQIESLLLQVTQLQEENGQLKHSLQQKETEVEEVKAREQTTTLESQQQQQLQIQQQQLQEQETQEKLKHHIALLEKQNMGLVNSIKTYETAIDMIATKSSQKLKSETETFKQQIQTLALQLNLVEQENANLSMSNIQLKAIVQNMVHAMREASTQRETELIESRSSAIEHEANNLRRMLAISKEYQSMHIFGDLAE